MTAEIIANFIGKKAYTVDKIIMIDMCDRLICESIYGGFIMTCSEQNLCRGIISRLVSIQQGKTEPMDFSVATRKRMETLWNTEEEAVIKAEF